MSRKAMALCLLWSVVNPAALAMAYHIWGSEHARLQMATLDVAEIYRLKENQFTALVIKAGATEADRAQAIELARSFGSELSSLTQSLPRECGCLILARAAVIGAGDSIPDLTPEIKRRFGL